jgi:hypothetical protein
MDAPFRSLPEGQILGEARNGDEMIAIWRAHKSRIGLSDRDFDDLSNVASGHTGKVLGPTKSKNFGPKMFAALNWTLAIKWVAVVDLEHAEFMAAQWADRQRDASNVRMEPNRVSKQLIERAKPYVLRELGEKLASALGDDISQVLLGMKLPDRGESVPSIPNQVVSLKVENTEHASPAPAIKACEPAKLATPQSQAAPAARAHLHVVQVKRHRIGCRKYG